MAHEWIPTRRGCDGRYDQYQIKGRKPGEIGVCRFTGNRPLRPYYLAGTMVEGKESGCFRTLAAAKSAAEDLISEQSQ